MHRKLAEREKQFLKELGATPTINSGATFGDADGLRKNKFCDDMCIEVKSTDAKSFSLKLETLKKVKKEANRIGLIPVLAVDIQKEKYVVLSANDFMTLLFQFGELDDNR